MSLSTSGLSLNRPKGSVLTERRSSCSGRDTKIGHPMSGLSGKILELAQRFVKVILLWQGSSIDVKLPDRWF